MAVLKSTEHNVTLTSFVADLSYPGLSNFYIMCEIDAREGADSLALIFAFTGCFTNNVTNSKRNISGHKACISTKISLHYRKVIGNNILNIYSKWSPRTRTVVANLLSKSPMAARTTCVGDLQPLTDQIFLCGLEWVLSQARTTSCNP